MDWRWLGFMLSFFVIVIVFALLLLSRSLLIHIIAFMGIFANVNTSITVADQGRS